MKTTVASLLLEKYGKKNPPAIQVGDTVRIHQKIKEGDKERVQIFEGLVIAMKHGAGLNGSFIVRKIAAGGIGVERTYPLHSPNIVKVERVKTAEVSRAKLYYMRDRLGKAARFNNEVRNPMSWDESGASTVIDTIDEQIIAEETIIAEIEGADAVAVEEIPAVADEVAPEEVPAAEESEPKEEKAA
jgi:large subunit ribosomal protein L19